jgi:hypothetical protein
VDRHLRDRGVAAEVRLFAVNAPGPQARDLGEAFVRWFYATDGVTQFPRLEVASDGWWMLGAVGPLLAAAAGAPTPELAAERRPRSPEEIAEVLRARGWEEVP